MIVDLRIDTFVDVGLLNSGGKTAKERQTRNLPSIVLSTFCSPRFHSNGNIGYSVAENPLRTGITLEWFLGSQNCK